MLKKLEDIYIFSTKYKNALLTAGLCLVLWLVVFHEAILSAAKVWWISDIYTHGYFVIPIAVYLIWRKRYELSAYTAKPAYIILIPIIIFALIYIIGVAGNISLFQHAAIFSILPLTVWFIFGTKIAKTITFPLLFTLFSIPFGEEFIPFLQSVTADNSVWLLRLIDVPVFRNGLYIEIPNGRFVVAEACSGVRFSVGAAVFGAIYAYISYTSRFKQFIFFSSALIIPIVANSIRVSLIILIGYLSDMKYATGVDHLVYGWFFFAIVLLLLIVIGNIWADKTSNKEIAFRLNSKASTKSYITMSLPLALIGTVYLILYTWSSVIKYTEQQFIELSANTENFIQGVQDETWMPKYDGASEVMLKEIRVSDDSVIDYYRAYYPYNTPETELISSANRIYDPNEWTLKSADSVDIKLKTDEHIIASLISLIGSNQQNRLVLYWYEVSDYMTSNKVLVKIIQSFEALQTKPGSGQIVIYSINHIEENINQARELLLEYVRNNYRYGLAQ